MSERNLPLPPELGRLSTFIDFHVECLAEPNSELRSIALYAAKYTFDWALKTEQSSKPFLQTLLSTLTEAAPPQTRSQSRDPSRPTPVKKTPKKVDIRETPLPSLFIEDMNIDQIWQQLDLRAARVCENLQTLLGEDGDEGENAISNEEDSDDSGSEDDDDEEMDIDEDNAIWEELSDVEDDNSSTAEGVANLRDEIPEDEDYGSPTSLLDVARGQKLSPSRSYSQGHTNLDDGFFDLATFNAETSELGENKVYKSKRKLRIIAEEDSAEELEVDLFGTVDDSATEGGGDDPAPIELFYNDFFEPPSRAQKSDFRSSKVRFHERVSVKKIKAVGKGMPVSSMGDDDSDEEEENE